MLEQKKQKTKAQVIDFKQEIKQKVQLFIQTLRCVGDAKLIFSSPSFQPGLKRLRKDVDDGSKVVEDTKNDPDQLIEEHRRGNIEMKDFVFEILKLCEEPQTSEEDKTKQAQAKLDQLCRSNDFLDFGGPLEGFGERYLKISDKLHEHGMERVRCYVGEWSKQTN